MIALRAGVVALSISLAHLVSAQAGAPGTGGAAQVAPQDVAQPSKNAHHSATGVASKILKTGSGRTRAKRNDCVMASYTIWKRDGSLLGSTGPSSQPRSVCLRTMFPGLAEAVLLMALGERRRIWIPANQTYVGEDDDKPAPLDLTVDFELLAIQKAPPIPPDLKAPPRSATKLESGVAFRYLQKGAGRVHPAVSNKMLLHFSGWTQKGDLIESTVMAGTPASFDLISAMRGWRDVLRLMVVKDKVRIWIPAALAFGDKPRRGQPKGDLIYDLELLAIE